MEKGWKTKRVALRGDERRRQFKIWRARELLAGTISIWMR